MVSDLVNKQIGNTYKTNLFSYYFSSFFKVILCSLSKYYLGLFKTDFMVFCSTLFPNIPKANKQY